MPDAQPSPPPPFRAERYTLGEDGLALSPFRGDEASVVGLALAAIDPWVRYRVDGEGLARLFVACGDGGIHLAVRAATDGPPIGVVVVRQPWLADPICSSWACCRRHKDAALVAACSAGSSRRDGQRAPATCGFARPLSTLAP